MFGAPSPAQSQISFYGTPTIPGCAAAVIGDFNRDGNLDVINCAGTVLLGKGDGTFTTGTTLSNVPSFVADFNGDGIPDVLAFTQSGNLYVYLGNGDGTFQAPKETHTGVPLYTPGLAVADLVTGNNDADVVVPNPAGGVLVFLGKGDGTFAAPVNYASPYAGQLFVGDFTGDGNVDILLNRRWWGFCSAGERRRYFPGGEDHDFFGPMECCRGRCPQWWLNARPRGFDKSDRNSCVARQWRRNIPTANRPVHDLDRVEQPRSGRCQRRWELGSTNSKASHSCRSILEMETACLLQLKRIPITR